MTGADAGGETTVQRLSTPRRVVTKQDNDLVRPIVPVGTTMHGNSTSSTALAATAPSPFPPQRLFAYGDAQVVVQQWSGRQRSTSPSRMPGPLHLNSQPRQLHYGGASTTIRTTSPQWTALATTTPHIALTAAAHAAPGTLAPSAAARPAGASGGLSLFELAVPSIPEWFRLVIKMRFGIMCLTPPLY